jgi:orotidine-5'-phosphate decarboxylase
LRACIPDFRTKLTERTFEPYVTQPERGRISSFVAFISGNWVSPSDSIDKDEQFITICAIRDHFRLQNLPRSVFGCLVKCPTEQKHTTESPMPGFTQRLHDRIFQCKTPALVGIDPRWDWLPASIRENAGSRSRNNFEASAYAFEAFSKQIIDIVAPLVPAVKPQVAFFEQLGVPGFQALHEVMKYARQAGLIVIADAKRGDIGSTAEAYADAWLAGEDPAAAAWPADALTINPYLGTDSLEPFVQLAAKRNAGLYVLVRTSNPGAAQFQDRISDGQALYSSVAATVQKLSEATRPSGEAFGCVGAVVGATWPTQLVELRKQMPAVPFLIPGYGAQGGTSSDTAGAFTLEGLGAVVNSSRGINFAWQRKPYAEQFGEARWQDAVEAATRDMIADLAQHTPAANL